MLYPLEMFTALVVVSGISLGSVWAGQNKAVINSFQRQNPMVFVITAILACYILIFALGSLMVFLFAVALPMSCKFF